MTSQSYSSSDIEVLSGRDHVRLRTTVYFGSMQETEFSIPIIHNGTITPMPFSFVPAAYKAFGEIVDNAVDELTQCRHKNKQIDITCDPKLGIYTISDNGRGIPIDIHKTGKPTPEVVLAQLNSGRNFKSNKQAGVQGQNGVGAACTNFCSKTFEVNVYRDKKHYRQQFSDGAKVIGKPAIRATTSKKTGTTIQFELDQSVFKTAAIPIEVIRNRAIETAMTNPDITVTFNQEQFRFPGGLSDVLGGLLTNGHKFTLVGDKVCGDVYLVPNTQESPEGAMFTWVNSSLLLGGGSCNVQLIASLLDQVHQHYAKVINKDNVKISKSDILHKLTILADLKISDPEFDSQSKTRLTGPPCKREVSTALENSWKVMSKSLSTWLNDILERAQAHNNSKAQRDLVKRKQHRVEGLLDATGKNRATCQLLITEGESAQSQICEVRNPETTAAIALSGKINNVFGCSVSQVSKMEKVLPLLLAIGLVPGKIANRDSLRYGRVIISTDADYDGDDIFTLLVNLFFCFWPELLDDQLPPFIYRLTAPNVCAVKDSQRRHFVTMSDYEKVKAKYKNWTIQYYKGLGSMETADWRMILSDLDSHLICIQDNRKVLSDTLNMLFGPDVELRKNWLSTTAP